MNVIRHFLDVFHKSTLWCFSVYLLWHDGRSAKFSMLLDSLLLCYICVTSVLQLLRYFTYVIIIVLQKDQLMEYSSDFSLVNCSSIMMNYDNVEQKIETKLPIVHLHKLLLKCWISFSVVTLQMSSLRRPWPRRDYKYVEASVNGGPRPWSLHNQGITKFLYFVLLPTLYYTRWLHNTVFAPILPRTDFAPGRRPDKWRGGAKLAMSIFDKTQKSQCVFLSAYKKLFCKHKQ